MIVQAKILYLDEMQRTEKAIYANALFTGDEYPKRVFFKSVVDYDTLNLHLVGVFSIKPRAYSNAEGLARGSLNINFIGLEDR